MESGRDPSAASSSPPQVWLDRGRSLRPISDRARWDLKLVANLGAAARYVAPAPWQAPGDVACPAG